MEFNIGEVSLSHLQHVRRVGKEYIASFLIGSHELVFATFEVGQSFFIIAFNPACLVERQRLPTALCAILVEQAVLYYLKLQLTYCTYDFAAVELIGEQLSHTFVHKLAYALLELFALHGVGILYVLEHLGREAGQAFEVYFLTRGNGVAYLEITCIGYADYIAGPCGVYNALFLSHECGGSREFQEFA